MHVYYNGVIVTLNEENEVLEQGYFIVNDVGIFETVAAGSPPLNLPHSTYTDLKGKWIIPGLVNTHSHTGMSLLRGISDDLPLQRWLQEKMWPMEGKFTKESVMAGSRLAMVEMVKSGTTTFLDMYHLHMDDIANQVVDAGMRAVITRGMIGLCPENEQQKKLKEATSLAMNWNGAGEGRIKAMLSPHALYTCPPAFIETIVSKAEQHDLPLHIHMSETAFEVAEHEQKYGKRPVHHLQELGFFRNHALVAHAVHINSEEIAILQENNVYVSHNPISNLKLGSGIAPIQTMLEKGVSVSVGTDSVASNNNFDLFQELRTAVLIQKGIKQDATALPVDIALKMATVEGAKALGFSQIGSIQEGMDADFITLHHEAAHLQPAKHVLSHLVYAASGADVVDVFVKGKQLVKDKECITLDEEKIVAEANLEFSRLQ
ncbi:amidohydrolase [Bacillus alkalicellulosilyticus]|uniref:amidohydrolase n=1 Tax=Alkalihalobacterium alkalicellulosilyticum TaxID=1912214 RepID=UPI00099633C0|nr:amidohydrolase [Bacillus alkalicellulosilyticus]